jgi:hypothetical protein
MEYNLCDSRLSNRANFCFKRILKNPSLSFPKIFSTPGELLGFYRFISNDKVISEELLAPVFAKSKAEAMGKELLVVHDTSEVNSSGLEEKVYLHASLLVDPHRPYVVGLANVYYWQRPVKTSEHDRWYGCAKAVEERFYDQDADLIHIMDREGDSYETLDKLIDSGYRFVIRQCHDRKDLLLGKKIDEVLRSSPTVVQREVYLSKRSKSTFPNTNRIYPERQSREALLEVKAKRVEIKRSEWLDRQGKKHYNSSLQLNVVHVKEVGVESGVSWTLLTTESIDTPEDILKIVDYYRKRWVIEEYFKALKSGCKLEERQFESIESYIKVLNLLLPIAIATLNLRFLEGLEKIFDEQDGELLEKLSIKYKQKVDTPLGIKLLIARLGGHIKSNGAPGWSVLLSGMQKFYAMREAWHLRCDI